MSTRPKQPRTDVKPVGLDNRKPFGTPGVITNLPVNTWMRAPGDFEGAFIMESIMEQVARAVQRDPVEVQELNHSGGMRRAYERLKAKVGYEARRKELEAYNQKSRRLGVKGK